MRRITRDSIPFMVGLLIQRAEARWCTLWSRIGARWWRIAIGSGCKFVGMAHFERHPNSRISIGASCVFRSSHTSNPSGINRPCSLTTLADGAEITIGNHCGFSGTALVCGSRVEIGNRVRCSPNTWIIDTDGHLDDSRTSPNRPIKIEDNVWLGANVTVLKGVTIGANTLVAAGSVVSRSLPGDVVAAGVPARVLRNIA